MAIPARRQKSQLMIGGALAALLLVTGCTTDPVTGQQTITRGGKGAKPAKKEAAAKPAVKKAVAKKKAPAKKAAAKKSAAKKAPAKKAVRKKAAAS